MNLVLRTSERTLVSFTEEEMRGLINALNLVCNDLSFPAAEFQTRLGVSKTALVELHRELLTKPEEGALQYEALNAWAAPASVMVRAISVYGDAVEMSSSEAENFVEKIQVAIRIAS